MCLYPLIIYTKHRKAVGLRGTGCQRYVTSNENRGQSNLVKGDIARMQKKPCRYLLSYSPGGSTCLEFVPGGCIWGRGGRRGSAMLPFERVISVSFLHCDSCAISNHSAAICSQMSPTLKSAVCGSLCCKIWGGWGWPM